MVLSKTQLITILMDQESLKKLARQVYRDILYFNFLVFCNLQEKLQI